MNTNSVSIYDSLYLGNSVVLREDTTYEDILFLLIQKQLLRRLDLPFRYQMTLQRYYGYQAGSGMVMEYAPVGKPVVLRERQTLASVHIMDSVHPESNHPRFVPYLRMISIEPGEDIRQYGHAESLKDGDFCEDERIECYIALVEVSIKEKPSSTSPNWETVISTIGNLFVMAATVASIVQGLDVIERRWREKRTTHNAPQQHRDAQKRSDSEIIAIRLLMTDGTQAQFKVWLDDPDELRKFIDTFNQPSSLVKPLQAIFLPKYNQATFLALEPMTDKTFCGCWLNRSKQFWATSSSTCLVSKSSQWVTSRRKCLHNISMGLSHGLYVGK